MLGPCAQLPTLPRHFARLQLTLRGLAAICRDCAANGPAKNQVQRRLDNHIRPPWRTPAADSGPLYGTILPILISVSVAPASYFFWARALFAATAKMTAVENAAN